MTSCIFCKIAHGELPSDKVYEDDTFIAIQALTQSTPGHTLIIPKEHSRDITTMSPELGNKLLELIQRIGIAQQNGLNADGFNVAVNTGSDAGQEIFHTHIHILPRYKEDGREVWPEFETPDEKRTEYALQIKEQLRR